MDRNSSASVDVGSAVPSLSARRAWIEISASGRRGTGAEVALRKESVDRNVKIMSVSSGLNMSLSARRAWIEISSVSA